MVYAKVDENGEVIQFPVRVDPIDVARGSIPENLVQVDTVTNRPTSVDWDKSLFYDTITRDNGNYIVNYRVQERFSDEESKRKGFYDLFNMKLDENEKRFKELSKSLLSAYPESERETWPQQRQEAEKYSADQSVATPLLSAISVSRGITVQQLVDKITAKSADYDAQYGTLIGKYQKNRNIFSQINFDDSTTWDQINNLVRL